MTFRFSLTRFDSPHIVRLSICSYLGMLSIASGLLSRPAVVAENDKKYMCCNQMQG